MKVGSEVARPDPIEYMSAVAADPSGVACNGPVLHELGLAPGHTVLDLGCGPGTDLLAMHQAVGMRGRVIGVDKDPGMLRAARDRTAGVDRVATARGDAHAVPLGDASVDRARTDRSLQHMADPV